MAKVGHIEIEVRPTVTLESAVACVFMLNLFLDGDGGYRLVRRHDGGKPRWALADDVGDARDKLYGKMGKERRDDGEDDGI